MSGFLCRSRRTSLSSLIVVSALAFAGCQKSSEDGSGGAEVLSNGPLKSLSSRRALVTGHLVALGGKGCKVPLTSLNIEVAGCDAMPFCSATIVRDSSVSASPFVLSAAHCFGGDTEHYNKLDCRQRKLAPELLRSFGLYFYSQATKKLIRLGRPVMHPTYKGWRMMLLLTLGSTTILP